MVPICSGWSMVNLLVYGKHTPGGTCLTKLSGAFLKKCVHSRPSGGMKNNRIGVDSFFIH